MIQQKSGPLAQLVEQLTFNQWVAGSNPARLTTFSNKCDDSGCLIIWVMFLVILITKFGQCTQCLLPQDFH